MTEAHAPPNALETLTLSDHAAQSQVWLAPGRGGLVTRFRVGDRPVLFLDEATLHDPSKNVRGGVPILFPSPGKLSQGLYSRADASGALGQHGFARNLPWTVEAHDKSSAVLSLESTPETRRAYPFDFRLRYRFALAGATLRIEQRFENRGPAPMPFACGFHPYFFVPDTEKAGARIETPATRAFDNAGQREVTLAGPIDLTAKEVNLHLHDHGGPEATLRLADGARIVVRGSPALSRWVIWTLAGRDFVCLEPWSAPGDALNTGTGLREIAPGGVDELWTDLSFLAP